MTYRSDIDALSAQCEMLRRELGAATEDAARERELRNRLEATLEELRKARLSEAERTQGARRRGRSALLLGLLLGSVAAFGWSRWTPADEAPKATTGRAWFDEIRGHCNGIEISQAIVRTPPPPTADGATFLAICQTLAGHVANAQITLDALEPADRNRAANTLFRLIHPIADAGNDIAAGPGMELVVRYQPKNFMALFHAGIAAHERGEPGKATPYLEDFLSIYKQDDSWTQRARKALEEVGAR